MNVLSLFDGLSCGQIALNRAGIKYDKYFASEVDKYAIKVTMNNYPNTVQLGDIRNIKASDLPTIDLLLGGSPCTQFSMSGTRVGMVTEDNVEVTSLEKYLELKQQGFVFKGQSYLFWEYVRLLKELKPKYFLLENVKMHKKWSTIITNSLGVDFIKINSSLVSAQNRDRLYWTNIPNVTQPEDKHIYLKDIIEHGEVDRFKSYCIDANYFKGGNVHQYFEKSRRQLVFDRCIQVGHVGDKSRQGTCIYATNGKSVTISATGGNLGSKTGLYTIAPRGRHIVDGKGYDTVQRLETSYSEKSSCLTTVQKDSLLLDLQNYIVRKLTPLECERLQTVPEGYTKGVSNSQRYKGLGNGWTVDVITHIFKGLKDNMLSASTEK